MSRFFSGRSSQFLVAATLVLGGFLLVASPAHAALLFDTRSIYSTATSTTNLNGGVLTAGYGIGTALASYGSGNYVYDAIEICGASGVQSYGFGNGTTWEAIEKQLAWFLN